MLSNKCSKRGEKKGGEWRVAKEACKTPPRCNPVPNVAALNRTAAPFCFHHGRSSFQSKAELHRELYCLQVSGTAAIVTIAFTKKLVLRETFPYPRLTSSITHHNVNTKGDKRKLPASSSRSRHLLRPFRPQSPRVRRGTMEAFVEHGGHDRPEVRPSTHVAPEPRALYPCRYTRKG